MNTVVISITIVYILHYQSVIVKLILAFFGKNIAKASKML